MNKDLGLSNAAFGFGSSLFFVAYYLFEIPSNIVLKKVGVRIWIARIMVTWGLAAAGCALVQGLTSFSIARFLVGAAEVGFFPGVIIYLTFWVPAAYRARIIAWFMVAIPAAGFFGSQLSGWLLSLNDLYGLRGWHWLFLVEGFPNVILGLICFAVLQNHPDTAKWLSKEEKFWLTARLARERAAARRIGEITIWQLARNKYVGPDLAVRGRACGRQRTRCLAAETHQVLRLQRPRNRDAQLDSLRRCGNLDDHLGPQLRRDARTPLAHSDPVADDCHRVWCSRVGDRLARNACPDVLRPDRRLLV